MSLAIFAIRVSRPLVDPTRVNGYRRTVRHFDLIPLALLSPPYISLHGSGEPCPPRALCAFVPPDNGQLFVSGAATGAGVNPLGFTTYANPHRNIAPSFGVTGGVLVFDRRIPTTRGAYFNFTAAVEAGLRIGPIDGRSLVLAYRFHHISNAGLAPENLAVASHLFTVAMRHGRPRVR
jgi:hypothetical protein